MHGVYNSNRLSCIAAIPALTRPRPQKHGQHSCSSVAISAVNITVPDLSNQQSMVPELNHPLIFAAAINVRWQKDDFALASSTPPPSSISSASVSGFSTSPTSVDSPGLSTGAKIGISVGAAVGGLAILGAVGYMLKWRKTSSHDAATVKEEPSDQWGRQEMTGYQDHNPELPTQSNTSETDGRMIYPEMYTLSNVPEMDGISKPPEVSTNR